MKTSREKEHILSQKPLFFGVRGSYLILRRLIHMTDNSICFDCIVVVILLK